MTIWEGAGFGGLIKCIDCAIKVHSQPEIKEACQAQKGEKDVRQRRERHCGMEKMLELLSSQH